MYFFGGVVFIFGIAKKDEERFDWKRDQNSKRIKNRDWIKFNLDVKYGESESKRK